MIMENQEINLDKVHMLIGTLKEQVDKHSTQEMLSTAQLIVAELQYLHDQKRAVQQKSKNVCVVMPFSASKTTPATAPIPEQAPAHYQETELEHVPLSRQTITESPGETPASFPFSVPQPPSEIEAPKVEQGVSLSAVTEKEVFTLEDEQPDSDSDSDSYPIFKAQEFSPPDTRVEPENIDLPDLDEQEESSRDHNKKRHLAFIADNFSTWADYGMADEAPTLVQNQSLIKEDSGEGTAVNDLPKQPLKELNEHLGQPEEEWAQKMQSTPIDNLSSAIGVNDRYLYISELFRGDESMYERSIITLNKFNNFHEAHAWSQRELRLKLGWDSQNPITQQFEQLIKRRFIERR